MADVFVSYKAEDRRRIQPLVQALQADGYSVALGLFVVTPLLLSWTDPSLRGSVTRLKALELLGGAALLALTATAVFTGALPFMYVLFPFLVLLAVRGRLLGATTGVIIVAMISREADEIWSTDLHEIVGRSARCRDVDY